ncbi:MAG: NlpC/P60 family protein [Actinomycetota bacterium]|nr:NlpC/P60 family protein [Actinomycetota bacterium]
MKSAAPRVAVALTALAIGVLALGLAVLGGAVSNSASSGALIGLELSSQSCDLTGPVVGLTPEQANNADVIVSTAFADADENPAAARLALMVAITESGLQDLGPLPGNDGSLGLFQQRVSEGWGTASEEMDPAQSTSMFVSRLLAVSDWSTKPPWQVAQKVQRSRFSDGSNYQANWPRSGVVLAEVESNADQPGGCGQGIEGGVAGPASAFGLPVGYSIPAGTSAAHVLAVEFALAQLGKPYVWGASGPTAFDCSGLTMEAWAAAGVRLEHYTVDQLSEGTPIPAGETAAGDLVFVPGSDPPGPGLPGHVGIYLGYGLVLSAVDPEEGVVVQTWSTFVSGGLDGTVDPDPGP